MKARTINISAHAIVSKMDNNVFMYTTRCMCSFVTRHCKSMHIDDASLMLVELRTEPRLIAGEHPIYTCNSTCRVLVQVDCFKSYMPMPPKDKKRSVLRWIEQAGEMCVREGVMPLQSLSQIRESIGLAESLNYEHKYFATRPALSPSRKLKAVVEVHHDTDICTGDMVIMDRRGSELVRARVFEEKPDELIFKKWLTRPSWRGDLGVILQPDCGIDPAREVSVGGDVVD